MADPRLFPERIQVRPIRGAESPSRPLLPVLPLAGDPRPWATAVELAQSHTAELPNFWLDGHSLLAPCPECDAPMTVRLWLRTADCWQCQVSVALSEADVAALIARTPPSPHFSQPARTVPTAAVQPRPSVEPVKPVAKVVRPPVGPAKQSRVEPPAEPQVAASHVVIGPLAARRAVPPTAPPIPRRRSTWDWLDKVPAWLISTLFHLIVLLILALLANPRHSEIPSIRLALTVDEGVTGEADDPLDALGGVHFDVPPSREQPQDPDERQWRARAEQEAKQLRMDPRAKEPLLPELETVKAALLSHDVHRRTLAMRDPRLRAELIEREGGTTSTEAAVARGLRWLDQHQHRNGRWSLHRFNSVGQCDGQCDGEGYIESDSAATSLCLLPFLGAGQTHLTGKYRETVARGLSWLLDQQRSNGDLRGDSHGNAGMYAHGQGTIVLCEAYGMTRDETLRRPAERAVRFILAAQHEEGGWRYSPGERGDTSVLGWQLMALQSARAAGIAIPDEHLQAADAYLDTVAADGFSRYAYQPGHPPTHVMTAEALLCRFYLGWKKSDPGVVEGVRYLVEEHPPSWDEPNIYYWYYGTQTLHHFGGRAWDLWNQRMRRVLVDQQERHGHLAGSWSPAGPFSQEGGRLYTTALSICTLEVYYRHAPIFRAIDVDGR